MDMCLTMIYMRLTTGFYGFSVTLQRRNGDHRGDYRGEREGEGRRGEEEEEGIKISRTLEAGTSANGGG